MASYTGHNLGGADFVLAHGDILSGTFSGINRFIIPAGVKPKVRPFDGVNHGRVHIQAQIIITEEGSDFSAKAAGPGPGGGGAGAPGQHAWDGGSHGQAAIGGDGCRGGQKGGDSGQWHGGEGGLGGGDFSGDPGRGGYDNDNNIPTDGGMSGYRVKGGNGDASTDASVYMGSAGPGGGGARSSNAGVYTQVAADGASSGAAGDYAGGCIMLESFQSMIINGKLDASAGDFCAEGGFQGTDRNGLNGGNGARGGNAVNPGNCWGGRQSNGGGYRGWWGGNGGPASGGGIVLIHRGHSPLQVRGTFDTRGSIGQLPRYMEFVYDESKYLWIYYNGQLNFGSTKIFARRGSVAGSVFNTGWNNVYGQPLIRIGADAISGGLFVHPVTS